MDEMVPPRLPRKVRPLSEQQLNRIRQFIEVKIAQDIPIAALSSELGMSPSHFSHCFKKTAGVTPHAFVVQHKMLRAAQLLIETHDPLEKVAERIGFTSLRHFRRQFYKNLGCNPSDMRQAVKTKFSNGKLSVGVFRLNLRDSQEWALFGRD